MVDDLVEVANRMPGEPVLIGHSMGGMVVQKYLERHTAPGVVLLASVPPQGLLGSALGLAFRKPGLMTDLNRMLGGGHPDPAGLHDALFHQPQDEAKLMRYYNLMQPEVAARDLGHDPSICLRPLLLHRVPMLIIGAEHDNLIPPDQVETTARTTITRPRSSRDGPRDDARGRLEGCRVLHRQSGSRAIGCRNSVPCFTQGRDLLPRVTVPTYHAANANRTRFRFVGSGDASGGIRGMARWERTRHGSRQTKIRDQCGSLRRRDPQCQLDAQAGGAARCGAFRSRGRDHPHAAEADADAFLTGIYRNPGMIVALPARSERVHVAAAKPSSECGMWRPSASTLNSSPISPVAW